MLHYSKWKWPDVDGADQRLTLHKMPTQTDSRPQEEIDIVLHVFFFTALTKYERFNEAIGPSSEPKIDLTVPAM